MNQVPSSSLMAAVWLLIATQRDQLVQELVGKVGSEQLPRHFRNLVTHVMGVLEGEGIDQDALERGRKIHLHPSFREKFQLHGPFVLESFALVAAAQTGVPHASDGAAVNAAIDGLAQAHGLEMKQATLDEKATSCIEALDDLARHRGLSNLSVVNLVVGWLQSDDALTALRLGRTSDESRALVQACVVLMGDLRHRAAPTSEVAARVVFGLLETILRDAARS